MTREALPELREPPVRSWIGAREHGDEADAGAALQELSRQLEGDRASGAVARNDIGTVGPKGANLTGKVGGQLLDVREGLALTIGTGGL